MQQSRQKGIRTIMTIKLSRLSACKQLYFIIEKFICDNILVKLQICF